MAAVVSTDWMKEAACRGMDTNLWFPVNGALKSDLQTPKAICAACPVITPCLDVALSDPDTVGVWGGTTGRWRRDARVRLGIRGKSSLTPPRSWARTGHGTPAGYKRHLRAGTIPCDFCKRANADQKADLKARKQEVG
jgi:WhiB family redox-sensing transcriptional regulator